MSQELFQKYYDRLPVKPRLIFTEPGKERQDSVYNGFAVGSSNSIVILFVAGYFSNVC